MSNYLFPQDGVLKGKLNTDVSLSGSIKSSGLIQGKIVYPNGVSSWREIEDKPFDYIDNNTLIVEDNTLKVNTTDDAESDNTLPITSSGVYTIVGNIDALLSLI